MELGALSESGQTVVLHIQVTACYSEPELKILLDTIVRRGANYRHWGDGRYRVHVPVKYSWVPFFKAIKSCGAVELTNIVTVNQRHVIHIEPEG